ncbi:MAG: ATP-grasp fold amidoligase family protein [Balneolaceae bacterium]
MMFKKLQNKLFWGGLRHLLSDRQYALIRYRLELGFFPDLMNPKWLSEKIQYLKLYERTEQRREVADRIRVRDFVHKRVGESILIPQLGVYKKLNRTVWEELPNQFVLKASHGSGFIRIVNNKEKENFEEINREVNRWLNTDYYKFGREWVYKGLERLLIVEKLLLDRNNQIPADYKFYCFDGKVELIQVDIGRFTDQQRFFFDRSFNPVDVKLYYPEGDQTPEKPKTLNEGIRIAEKLSETFNFIRVDLFLLDDHVWFGEMTNYPANGFRAFEPVSVELEMGRKLRLN